MPAKNSLKQFAPDTHYHLYNRGVEKRKIFMDEQDYSVFLSYIKTYLLPKDTESLWTILRTETSTIQEKDRSLKLLRMNNFSDSLILIAYCLMPNHFHLLVKQKDAKTIDKFMNSLCTRYSMYFNKKYKRVGKLFQGVYKAVIVETDEQLLHLTRYIHKNPTKILASLGVQSNSTATSGSGYALQNYQYSSYREYIHSIDTSWIYKDDVLSFFAQTGFNSYESFVEDNEIEEQSVTYINEVQLDEN